MCMYEDSADRERVPHYPLARKYSAQSRKDVDFDWNSLKYNYYNFFSLLLYYK